jgi:hypothetical protein
VNGEGGERRPNVLFSRVRGGCDVFASFDPGNIDPNAAPAIKPGQGFAIPPRPVLSAALAR